MNICGFLEFVAVAVDVEYMVLPQLYFRHDSKRMYKIMCKMNPVIIDLIAGR